MNRNTDRAMFQTLASVQSSEAIRLQQCIDNRGGNLRIDQLLTQSGGEDGESISWRAAEDYSRIFKYSIAPGLYNITYFRNIVRRLGINISLSVDSHKGLILLVQKL